jgi:hypothetical protein
MNAEHLIFLIQGNMYYIIINRYFSIYIRYFEIRNWCQICISCSEWSACAALGWCKRNVVSYINGVLLSLSFFFFLIWLLRAVQLWCHKFQDHSGPPSSMVIFWFTPIICIIKHTIIRILNPWLHIFSLSYNSK